MPTILESVSIEKLKILCSIKWTIRYFLLDTIKKGKKK